MKRRSIILTLFTVMVIIFGGCSSASKENGEQPKEDVIETSDDIQTEDSTATPDPESDEGKEVAQQPKEIPAIEIKKGSVETVNYDSKAISENLIDEKTVQQLYIYLPPTYSEGEKNYPVVYFLHGFGDSPLAFAKGSQRSLDKAFSENPSKEFILVAVDGANSAGGTYYVNSPVIGKWDDYTTKEVVSYIDSTYRTIAKVESRGICGFSMGGFGAINLALLHPDVFSCVYSICPGALAPGEIGDALDSWSTDPQFLRAYSLAFAYNDEAPYETLPLRDNSDADNALMDRWEAGFGHWEEKLDAYLSLNTPLSAISITYGIDDFYGWIPSGTKYLSNLMIEKGISNQLTSFNGGHMIPPNAMPELLLPFFQGALIWE